MATEATKACIHSELGAPGPKASVAGRVRECDEEELFLSVIAIGKREEGIAELPYSTKRATVEQWVQREIAARSRGKLLLVIDSAVAARWGSIVGASETCGQLLPVIDGLIAATSLPRDFTVFTRNMDDPQRCGARCFSQWVEK